MRVVASTLEDVYLEVSRLMTRDRRSTACARACAGRCSRSLLVLTRLPRRCTRGGRTPPSGHAELRRRRAAELDPDALAGAIVFGLAMFAILFLGAVLSVFLTLNVVRGDAEAGCSSRSSCGRSDARSCSSRASGRGRGVCVAYVLGVFFSRSLSPWAGGWSPDRVITPARARCGGRAGRGARPRRARSSSRRSRTGSAR